MICFCLLGSGPRMFWFASHNTHYLLRMMSWWHPLGFGSCLRWDNCSGRLLERREGEERKGFRSTVRPPEEKKKPGSHSPSHKLFHNVKPSLILSTVPTIQTKEISAFTAQWETGKKIGREAFYCRQVKTRELQFLVIFLFEYKFHRFMTPLLHAVGVTKPTSNSCWKRCGSRLNLNWILNIKWCILD